MKADRKTGWNRRNIVFVVGAFLTLTAGMAGAPSVTYADGKIINSEDPNKYIGLGMGIRTEFVAQEHGAANGGGYSNNFGVNNARIYINGGINKYVKFEFNTECFNCQNSFNNVGQGANSFGGNATVGILDTIGKFEFNQYVNIWAGRLLLPTERGELNGPFFMPVFDGFKTPFESADFSGNFGKGGAGLYGRDNGVVFWGQVDPAFAHVQYSLGISTGLLSAGSPSGWSQSASICVAVAACGPNQQNNLMYSGRITFNFLNPEKNPGYYTSGTYYGKAGDILAVAGGFNYQKDGAGSFLHKSDMTALFSDVLFEKPLANDGGVITFNGEFKAFFANYNPLAFTDNSGNFGMFRGQSYHFNLLYLIPYQVGIGRFQPYGQYTYIHPNQSSNRWEAEAGVNYVIEGHNARVSAFWQNGNLATRGLNYAPNVKGSDVNLFHLALQLQY